MLLRSLLLIAALAVAFSPAPEAPPESDATTVVANSASGHMLVIEYIDTRGPYRRARVSVRSEAGARTPWSGQLKGVHLEGLQRMSSQDRARFRRAGFTPSAEFLSSGHTTGSNIVAPAPDNLKRVWLRSSRGPDASFRVPTRSHNPSTEGDKEGDEDSDGGDQDGDGDGDDDDDDDESEECTGLADCVGLVNPWTCECTPEVIDPWGGEPKTSGPTTQVSF